MTSMRVASDLASVLVPIGVTGAVLAVLCAIVAAAAIVRGAGGLSGGAVGVWIPCAMLTLAAGFANQWTPLLVSAAALVGMLIIGGVARAILSVSASRRPEVSASPVAQAAEAAPEQPMTPVATPVSAPAPARPAVAAALTGTVSTLTRPNPARAA